VTVASDSNPLVLMEGEDSKMIEFRTYLPPGVSCWPVNALANRRDVIRGVVSNVFGLNPPCDVKIEMTTSNYVFDYLPYLRSIVLDVGRAK